MGVEICRKTEFNLPLRLGTGEQLTFSKTNYP